MDTENRHPNLTPKMKISPLLLRTLFPSFSTLQGRKQYALLLYIHTYASALGNVLVSPTPPVPTSLYQLCSLIDSMVVQVREQPVCSAHSYTPRFLSHLCCRCEPLWCKYTGRYGYFTSQTLFFWFGSGFKLSLSYIQLDRVEYSDTSCMNIDDLSSKSFWGVSNSATLPEIRTMRLVICKDFYFEF